MKEVETNALNCLTFALPGRNELLRCKQIVKVMWKKLKVFSIEGDFHLIC